MELKNLRYIDTHSGFHNKMGSLAEGPRVFNNIPASLTGSLRSGLTDSKGHSGFTKMGFVDGKGHSGFTLNSFFVHFHPFSGPSPPNPAAITRLLSSRLAIQFIILPQLNPFCQELNVLSCQQLIINPAQTDRAISR